MERQEAKLTWNDLVFHSLCRPKLYNGRNAVSAETGVTTLYHAVAIAYSPCIAGADNAPQKSM